MSPSSAPPVQISANIVADIDAGASPALITATLQFLYDEREKLPMFVVYDHPVDFPQHYVAVLWVSAPVLRLPYVLRASTIERLRDMLDALGLTHLHRYPDDDPRIMETWL
jgi:hypothetical protein